MIVSAVGAEYFSFDLWFSRLIQRHSSPVFRGLMIAVSWPGNDYHPLIIALSCAALLLIWQHRIEAGCLLFSGGGASLLTNLLKIAIGRPRPAAELVEIYRLHTTDSFPSGHVLGYVATYGFLFYLVWVLLPCSKPRLLLLCGLGALVLLVGPSRIYLGAHWASDVAGGYCLGSIWLALAIDFYWHLKLHRTQPRQ
jgi:undecaprenyl-diphosphatase